MTIHCFLPIEDNEAKLLILGSIPGKVSLDNAQYYAHPRNTFWPIMGELTGALPQLAYELRTQKLNFAGIALWDVLASCIRPGSLDSDISSIVPNDFETFFMSHPHITRIYFNGAMAEKSYKQHVLPTLTPRNLCYLRLPSTSPAHAALTYDQKLSIWRTGIQTK